MLNQTKQKHFNETKAMTLTRVFCQVDTVSILKGNLRNKQNHNRIMKFSLGEATTQSHVLRQAIQK